MGDSRFCKTFESTGNVEPRGGQASSAFGHGRSAGAGVRRGARSTQARRSPGASDTLRNGSDARGLASHAPCPTLRHLPVRDLSGALSRGLSSSPPVVSQETFRGRGRRLIQFRVPHLRPVARTRRRPGPGLVCGPVSSAARSRPRPGPPRHACHCGLIRPFAADLDAFRRASDSYSPSWRASAAEMMICRSSRAATRQDRGWGVVGEPGSRVGGVGESARLARSEATHITTIPKDV